MAWKRRASLGLPLGANYVTSLFLGGCTFKAQSRFLCHQSLRFRELFFYSPKIPITQGYFGFFSWFVTVNDFHPNINFFASDFFGTLLGIQAKNSKMKEKHHECEYSKPSVYSCFRNTWQGPNLMEKSSKKDFPAKLGNGNLVFEPPIWKMQHNQIISSPILGVNMKNLSNYLQV